MTLTPDRNPRLPCVNVQWSSAFSVTQAMFPICRLLWSIPAHREVHSARHCVPHPSPMPHTLAKRRTLRFFGHSDGNGYPGHLYTAFPIQTSLGVFSEQALQRYDFVLAQCAQVRTTAAGPLNAVFRRGCTWT